MRDAYELVLPAPLPAHGWKVKIRGRERLEPPHVTIIRKTKAWRFSLREMEFMDREPDPSVVPDELISAIKDKIEEIQRAWDEKYPENPVGSKD